jgi:hypothetical protein
MVTLASDQDVDLAKASESIEAILTSQITGSLATYEPGHPLLCTVYFAYGGSAVWFTSQELTRHIRALRDNAAACFAVWRVPDAWGQPLLGLQLTGRGLEVTTDDDAAEGLRALHQRFPGTSTTLPDVSAVWGATRRTALVRFAPQSGTLIDESTFGPRNFIRFRWVPS